MSAPRPFEDELLAGARYCLSAFTSSAAGSAGSGTLGADDVALEVLEAASSCLGGFDLGDYRRIDRRDRALSTRAALDAAEVLLREIRRSRVPPSLALSSLGRQPLPRDQERTTGAFYTDFRLAQHVAERAGEIQPTALVVDPACGTGILLVAAGLAACGPDRHRAATWIAECAWGADLSDQALRGAQIALASLCDDAAAIRQMGQHLLCRDSLLAGPAAFGSDGPKQFDLVVANPPWEKLKATRHEFLQAAGTERHYGATYGQTSLPHLGFDAHKRGVASYAAEISARYPLTGRGEADLYKAFAELFTRLVAPAGRISALLPAGLVRSQGTEALRRFLFDRAQALDIEILENRSRFFGIDTRFKFLSLYIEMDRVGEAKRRPITVRHARGTETGIEELGRASIGREALERARPDLSVPEVRGAAEWKLFLSMSEAGEDWSKGGSTWEPTIVRELDMTRDRKHFRSESTGVAVALVEGRMVHQHRFAAKGYRSGTGRRARWEPLPLGTCRIEPQFWVPKVKLTDDVRERVTRLRAGFCDITGQTNERSLLAAMIPPGVVCGNKVPTVTFDREPSEDRLFLWLAIVNSLPFDWMLRRVITTTVNYFLLQSVPLPKIRPDSLPGRALVAAARRVHALSTGVERAPSDAWVIADARASMDVTVAQAYGVTFDDLRVILDDFPLLDRGQPSIHGEPRSTVTRDLVLFRGATRYDVPVDEHRARLEAARAAGAVPYVPSEFVASNGHDLMEIEDG